MHQPPGQVRLCFEDIVHVLLDPLVPLEKLTGAIKGVSARDANARLGRTGKPFWQDESFDHWIRGPGQFARTQTYIENNPVKAGLVARAEDHPWSSAAEPRASAGISPGAAGTSARATSG